MKLNKTIDRFYDYMEKYKQQFIGKRPTPELENKIAKDLGLDLVVFWGGELTTYFQTWEVNDEVIDEYDLVISDSWHLVDEDDSLIYQSTFTYLILDIRCIGREKNEVR